MKISKDYKNWQENILNKVLKDYPERKKEFTTTWGRKIKRLYTPQSINYLKELSFPGKYPYTRGIQPTMYRGKLWTMRQYAGFGSSRDTNKRFKFLLKNGLNGLSVAFDLPTQIGLDSDDPKSFGEVGRIGVAVDSLADFEEIFKGIKLNEISVSMTINSTAIVLLAMYIVLAQKQKVSKDKISGTVQNDILKEYIARGTYIFPIEESLKIVTDIIEYSTKNLPKFNSISISGYHIRESGSNALQELTYTFANAIIYVKNTLKRNINIDDFAPRVSFFLCSQINFFEEIAKFKAARRLWAKIMRKEFNACDPKSLMFRFHTQTAGSSLITKGPLNNITRITTEALAAILGGTQSLHTDSYDEALTIPTREAVDIALKTQQILAYETDITSTIDPLGGSYFIEELTNKFEKDTQKELGKIDKMGGMIKAIESGFIKKEIEKSAYKKYQSVNKGEEIVVGFNKFEQAEEERKKLKTEKYNTQKEQIKKLKNLKIKRNNKNVKISLKNLRKTLKQRNKNLMDAVIECVRTYCTIGEIVKEMKKEYGEYKNN